MPTIRIKDAAKEIGVSTRTLMRWFKDGKVEEVDRDRNNHRLFDEADIQRIKVFADRRIASPTKMQPLLFVQGGRS